MDMLNQSGLVNKTFIMPAQKKRSVTKASFKRRDLYFAVVTAIISLLFVKLSLYLGNFFVNSVPKFGDYFIEPIFIVYFVFLVAMCRAKNRKRAMITVYVSFFVLFICSKCGADYYSYKSIYEEVGLGVPFQNIHGEILYLLINRLASFVMPFEAFKIIYLAFFVFLLCYSLYKITPDPVIAFLLVYCGLTLYLLSSLRQFATISLLFYSILLVKRKKKFGALLITFVSGFIHVGGFVGFIVVCCFMIYRKNEKPITLLSLSIMIVFAVVLRLIFVILLRYESVASIMNIVTVYTGVRFFTVGVLSRIVELVLLSIAGNKLRSDSFHTRLFNVYCFAMLLYLAVPIEFFMARLLISFRFIMAMLMSVFIGNNGQAYAIKSNRSKQIKFVSVASMFVLYVVLFVYQLAFQIGYTPYKHIILTVN